MSRGSHVVILSGSLPPAVPKDFYAKAVAHFKSLGCTAVLAEYCWRVFGGLEKLESRVGGGDAAKWAVAAGSAACTMPGGAPPDTGAVDGLFRR